MAKVARQGTTTVRAKAPQKRRVGHERRIAVLTLLTALPGALVGLVILWTGDYSPKVQWTLTLFVVLAAWVFAAALLHRVVFPLRTLSNMLAALREGDFSLRARGARSDDALGEVLLEVNALGETLRAQRLGALEATTLLGKIMTEIDVAVFAFDAEGKLRLVNQRGERLLAQPAERLLARRAVEVGLAECLSGETPRIVDFTFPGGGAGRWEVRRSTFRQDGLPHQLLVLSDLTQTLREEERQAWKRLIQVLRHEINNSLAPIDSLAGSLTNLLQRDPAPADWKTDMTEGLTVIRERSSALNRFMTAYSQLTRLPKPRLAEIDVGEWVQRAASLETRKRVGVRPGPQLTIQADGDQLAQLLINLIRNAVDAVAETGGDVRIGWNLTDDRPRWLEVWVEDGGPGLSSTENLFVPFYTTKPGGAGIGLALSRQIAEGHGGQLTLENRQAAPGCRACLRLPIDEPQS
jgi:nitrogen fixation/metabolism regulation signal transduction histidine kinase